MSNLVSHRIVRVFAKNPNSNGPPSSSLFILSEKIPFANTIWDLDDFMVVAQARKKRVKTIKRGAGPVFIPSVRIGPVPCCQSRPSPSEYSYNPSGQSLFRMFPEMMRLARFGIYICRQSWANSPSKMCIVGMFDRTWNCGNCLSLIFRQRCPPGLNRLT